MPIRAYLDLLLGTQALRRLVERDALDLGGALGVRAFLLPHQVASVQRILTAPRVRHLLADEVGLGKTIQAIMVLSALRQQDPEFRALVVVPNELRAQWRDELWTRGHHAPAEAEHEHRRVRLAWPEGLKGEALGDIDPDRYHALVVDEFHDLRKDIQQRILDTSSRFRHFLLISATPPFQDPERRAELLRMLEPSKVALLHAEDATDALRGREELVARLLAEDADVERWLDEGFPAPPPADTAAVLAQAHCIYRRVVRTRRESYREYMPAREHRPLTVEPTSAEVERQRLLWRYLPHLPDLTRQFDAELLAQRTRSAKSLQQRITYLRGHGHEREGLLDQIAPLLDRAHGDSRYEALVDLLNEIWLAEPGARVLVAAGDNLTVDALLDQLPEALDSVGPPGDQRPLVALPLRTAGQEVVGADSLADPDDVIEQCVAAFTRGEANLLIASRVGKLGLNLQYTRHIVLYSVPWDPQEVEQWIGRVDRIGNEAALGGHGKLLPIEVYTICQRGLVDERVVRVLSASSIFRRSISLDGTRVAAVRDGIRDAALARGAAWDVLEADATDIARSHDELGSALQSSLPWDKRWATAAHGRLVNAGPVEPAARAYSDDPQRAREEALRKWLRALGGVGEYVVRFRKDAGVHSLHYSFVETPGPKSKRPLRSRGLLREVFDGPRDGRGRDQVPFIVRRTDLQQPPRREVTLWDDDVPRNLYFMHHGSPLHDDLVEAWRRIGEGEGPRVGRVLLCPDHPALKELRGKQVAIFVGRLDASLPEEAFSASVLRAIAGVPGGAAAGLADVDLIEAFRADLRFMRALLPAQLVFGGVVHVGKGTWCRVPREQMRALLDPEPLVHGPTPKAMEWEPSADVRESVSDALKELEAGLRREGLQTWTSALPAWDREVEGRKYLVDIDATQELELAERALDAAKASLKAVEALLAPLEDTPMLSATERQERGQLRRERTVAGKAHRDAVATWARAQVAQIARQDWLEGALRHPREAAVMQFRVALLSIGEGATAPRGHPR